jgi:site-specific recombinase XerD
MNKLEQNYQELESLLSPDIHLYLDYFFTTNKRNTSSYYKLVELRKFLDFYATEYLKKSIIEITMDDLEQTPLDAVVDYVGSLRLKPNGKKLVIKILSAFWNYYTVASFTIEKQAPHFYRNVMNEWEVVYGAATLSSQSKPKENTDYIESYNLQEILDYLDMIDNYLVTYLTKTKARNWERNKERDLAIVALLAGTGVDIEQLAQATYRDIDLKKRTLTVSTHRGELIQKSIIKEFIPYISPYVKERRKWYNTVATFGSLFLNYKKQPLSSQGIASVIHRISTVAKKPLSAIILKQTHSVILFEKNKDLSDLTTAESQRLTKSIKERGGIL